MLVFHVGEISNASLFSHPGDGGQPHRNGNATSGQDPEEDPEGLGVATTYLTSTSCIRLSCIVVDVVAVVVIAVVLLALGPTCLAKVA